MTPDRNRPTTTVLAVVAAAAVTSTVLLATSARGDHSAAVAAADTGPAPATVSVAGVGTVQGVPDTLTTTLDVHVTRGSVQSALDGVAAATARVLAAARHAGLARRAVQTSSLQLYPHYDDHGVVRGYDATETVTVRISPLRRAGATLSSVVTAAGNDVSVDGMSFDIVDDSALLRQARADAFGDAKARAQQYADLSGRSLARVEKVTESVQESSPPVRYDVAAASAAAMAKAVPVRPGQQPVTVTVTVVWDLR